MRVLSSFLAGFCLLALVACDDGGTTSKSGLDDGGTASKSGLDRSKYLDELSANEIQKLCSWMADLTEPGEHECSNGLTMTTYTASECVERAKNDPPPHCLVSLTEDCLSSTGGDACKVLTTAVCQTYIACAAKMTSGATGN